MSSEPTPLTPARLVEAALFTAGRPVGLDELVDATGLDVRAVKRALKALEMEYEDAGDATAMEVRQAGSKWAMQLRAVYVEHARKLADMEIPKKLLKTLALIAFHQPLRQSELVDMIGSKTYDHVGELTELGLVKARIDGTSKRLTTSESFPEYFGIPATDTVEIRTFLAKKVGLELKAPDGSSPLTSFEGEGEGTGQATDEAPDAPAADAAAPAAADEPPTEDMDMPSPEAGEAADPEEGEREPESAAVTTGIESELLG